MSFDTAECLLKRSQKTQTKPGVFQKGEKCPMRMKTDLPL